jgi:capsular exopolysaccharide synthesis family protein
MSRISEVLRRATAGGGSDTTSGVPTPEEPIVTARAFPTESLAAYAPENGSAVRLLEEQQTFAFQGFNPEWTDRLVTSSNASAILVEQFRRLAALLHQSQLANGLKRVMVTSAAPGDGKTLTAVNLALILSESYGRNVLLIDGDLRRPSIRNVSQLGEIVGLSEGLNGKADQTVSILRLTKTLALLPGGRAVPDPMRGLTSPRMERILREAAERFDWVIVDAPPVGILADAAIMAGMLDTSLFVIRAGHTPHKLASKAIEALGRERIFGVVLNATNGADGNPYAHYYGQLGVKRRNHLA